MKVELFRSFYLILYYEKFQVRKQVQKVLMILDGLGVPFKAIDITLRGNEQHRDFMRQNAQNERCDGVPLPPQFFVDDEYLGVCFSLKNLVEENYEIWKRKI